MKIRRLFYGLALASIAFAISSFGINAVSNSDIISVKTKPEAIQAKFNPITDASSYKAYIKSSGDYTELDSELIFVKNDYVEVNAVGLTNGTYSLKLVPIINNNEVESSKIELSNISVDKDDRSGYAHFNYTDGVGAYNDEGTLKDNAIVVYVNDSNKNTVEATINGSKKTGLANIIKAADENYPLDIRITDVIKTVQWNKVTYSSASKTTDLYNEQSTLLGKSGNFEGKVEADDITNNSYSNDLANGITKLNGLKSYATSSIKDKGKDTQHYEWDSYWNMLDIEGKKHITIEGIGDSAGIFQWGITFKRCNSIEVKNLTFEDYTEDGIGIQGGSNSDMEYSNFWLHNLTFEQGVNNWDLSYELDKSDGDGSTDFKYAHNLTISYTKYNDTHKTSLFGSSNDALQYNITVHHNYYKACKARLPLVRQANIHIYNNYFEGTTSTGISVRANSNAFIENNYFDGKNPFMLAYKTSSSVDPIGTTIKAIGNAFSSNVTISAIGKDTDQGLGLMANGIYVLTKKDTTDNPYSYNSSVTRTTQSSGSVCTPDGTNSYVNFDTNSDFFYYENNVSKVSLMNNASTLPSLLPTISGVIFNDTTYTIVQEQEAEDDNYVIYDSLLDVDFKNETISSSEVSKGLYYTYSNGTSSATLNNLQIVDDRLYIYDNSTGTTDGYYVFENNYNSGIIKYIVEFSAPSNGNWTMLTFEGSTQIGIGTNPDKKRLSYKVGNDDQVVLLNNAMKDNKKNKVILTIDYDKNIANVNINGTQGSDFTYNSAINKLHFKTANSDTRSFYVDSISVMKEGTQVSGLDINTGYQMGQYSVQGTSYKAVRIIGKYEYSELFDDISDINYINIRFDIYDNSSNFFNSITIKISDIYPSLVDSNNNVLAPEKDNVRYFYAVINGITSSYNGYVINGTTIISANNKIIESSVSLTLEV